MWALRHLSWHNSQRRLPFLGRAGASKCLKLCCCHCLGLVHNLAGSRVEQAIHIVAHYLQRHIVRCNGQRPPLRIAIIYVNRCKHLIDLPLGTWS